MPSITSNLTNPLYSDRSIEAFLADKKQPLMKAETQYALEKNLSTEYVNVNSNGSIANKGSYFTEEQKAKFEVLKDDQFLNKRFISHLFGDSFMQDSIYEGWFVSDAMMHMITILEENEVTPEISQALSDLKGCFEWHTKLVSYLNSLNSEKVPEYSLLDNEDGVDGVDGMDEVEEIKPLPNKFITEVKDHIKNLEIGQKFLIPGMYSGHAVLYEVKKTDENRFMFAVYNTGDGVTKHAMITEDEGDSKVLGVYRLHNISAEKIIDSSFIDDLFKLYEERGMDFATRLYDDILGQLEGERDEIPTDPREYMLMQRSGTCGWKMFSAYLRYNLPLIQRKYVKLKARLDVFQKWYDLGYPLDCLKISHSLLGRLFVNCKYEIYQDDIVPINFSREELLAMGIYKAQKTFNKYKMLLNDEEVQKAETWYHTFTGQSIHVA